MTKEKNIASQGRDGALPDPPQEAASEKQPHPDPLAAYYAGLPSLTDDRLYSRVRKPRRVVWSIAWSDLMMTMFILFAVLYIYQAANREFAFTKKVAADTAPREIVETTAPPEVQTLVESADGPASHLMGATADTLRLRDLRDVGSVALKEDKAVRIVLPGDLLFDAGQVRLKTSALPALDEVADVIRLTDYRVNVVGHTDNVPMHSEKFATNWELSALRACTVARYMIEEAKLSADRFFITGHSYLQPVAANDTPKNRAANRRVELVLTRKRPAPTDRLP